MNILILNYEYPPLGGGAGIVTRHLANEFMAKEHKVTIVTTWFSGEPEYYTENNLTLIRLKAKRKHTHQSNPLEMYDWMIKAKKYCAKQFKAGDFDICLSNFTLPGGYVALHLKNTIGLPFFILSHGHDIPWFSPAQMFFWHLLCYPFIKKILQSSVNNIILTQELKQFSDKMVGKQWAQKNVVIPNGLLPTHIRKGFHHSDKSIKIVFAGRLVTQKNPLSILQAHLILEKQNIPIHLKIIGDGVLKQELENFVSINKLSNIEFSGKISHSQVMDELTKAHILVAPSREEAMSLVVLEAISCGVYVIATAISGNNELIEEGVNGDFVAYDQPTQIAQKISAFYNDKFLKDYQYPSLVLQNLYQNYSWKNTAEKYLSLFSAAINTNSKLL